MKNSILIRLLIVFLALATFSCKEKYNITKDAPHKTISNSNLDKNDKVNPPIEIDVVANTIWTSFLNNGIDSFDHTVLNTHTLNIQRDAFKYADENAFLDEMFPLDSQTSVTKKPIKPITCKTGELNLSDVPWYQFVPFVFRKMPSSDVLSSIILLTKKLKHATFTKTQCSNQTTYLLAFKNGSIMAQNMLIQPRNIENTPPSKQKIDSKVDALPQNSDSNQKNKSENEATLNKKEAINALETIQLKASDVAPLPSTGSDDFEEITLKINTLDQYNPPVHLTVGGVDYSLPATLVGIEPTVPLTIQLKNERFLPESITFVPRPLQNIGEENSSTDVEIYILPIEKGKEQPTQ